MQLKDYQQSAIEELLEKSRKTLRRSGDKKIVFKSPTGSGKTVMMAEFLGRLGEEMEERAPLAFIWTAPRKLHEQSREKLERYFENSRALICSEFEDLDDRQIQKNEILFFNWESINREDNVYIRENERGNNLSSVLARTRDAGREVVLVIDESHHHATSETSQRLVRDIAPKLTVQVSATPEFHSMDELVSVSLEEVKLEGMIKKSVSLNPDFENILENNRVKSALALETEALVIKAALEKRGELARAYEEEGASINPLLLIQLPDRKTPAEDQVKADVIRILKDEFGITKENGKLAIRLSNEHVNLENITRNTNEVEALIFKQAIALGWDCPRAQILVLFRDWRSLEFSVQTIGRIMRMPEPSRGHYGSEMLNHGYVYTNLENIILREDVAEDYVTIYTSRRIDGYEPVNLVSVHSKRHRERTRLASFFIPIFLHEAEKYGLKRKVKTEEQRARLTFISDFEAASADDLAGRGVRGNVRVNAENEADLQRLFDYFVRVHLSPFHPEPRSIGRVKESIYNFFYESLGFHYSLKLKEIIHIALSEDNAPHFAEVIGRAKEAYIAKTRERERELETTRAWEVPEAISYGGAMYFGGVIDYGREFSLIEANRSVMLPFYSNRQSGPEMAFIKHLEKSESVEWWFRNGDRDATYFAVPYEENGEPKPFYVDFIVRFKDGRIGLFDTKSGITINVAGDKVDGLRAYLAEHGERQNLFGGIVANPDSQNFARAWKIFNKPGDALKPGDFRNWDDLEI
ncbi:MAG: DEAD/DEAH box helicase family protein [Alphaproteobacteria bacterium]|nr:DEAD/DEAH box helicase family protein [Alphaproteobacteria bacterium]MDA8008594.1 DEAD/DEAH box helicase family protein [Alphaproteobacteria bacterium]